MGVTIHEVAREAGVSTSTVSNVLNGRTGKMRLDTRERVESVIRRLQYQPNRAARQLRAGGIRTLGLIVPSVSNPFWGTFASLFEALALEHGYGVLLCNSQRSQERELAYLEELRLDGVAGVVLGASLPSAQHLAPMISSGMRIVMLDRSAQPTDPPGLIDVSVDNFAGAALIGEHLWNRNHRRFAFITGGARSISRGERLKGFLSVLERHGGDRRDVQIWPETSEGVDFDADLAEIGRLAAKDILRTPDKRATAIVAVNDHLAVGAYRGIREEGLTVGRDVAVTGFDDILIADVVQPALTTVHQPLDQMAEFAVARLLKIIDNPETPPPDSVRLEPRLVVRESSAAPLKGF